MPASPTPWPPRSSAISSGCRAPRSHAQSWERYGAIIVVQRARRCACRWSTGWRPSIWSSPSPIPRPLAQRIRHAGAIFLGRYTPEAIGDYVAGPNHVLPTSRSARFSSGLGVLDFIKRTSLIGCDAAGLAAIGPAAVTLAEAEGLGAHALSVAIRLGNAGRGDGGRG